MKCLIRPRILRLLGWVVVGSALTCLGLPEAAQAQRLPSVAQQKKQAGQADPANQEEKTKPRPVDLDTLDGVLLATTYFPAAGGKNTPVVILMHGYGGTQQNLWDLAFNLQNNGYAVMTFDFRGHGHSITLARPSARPRRGTTSVRLNYQDLGRKIPYKYLLLDVEAVRRFLIERNNAAELNLSKLGIVGCELGASVAVGWAFNDWRRPAYVGFEDKQGHDVQVVVLVSPRVNFKGLTINRELAGLRIPVQVIVGKQERRSFDEGRKVYQTARRVMPVDSELASFETRLQGSKLVNGELGLGVEKELVEFLNGKLKSKIVKWERHREPHD